jgi:hypothetical protein
MTQQVFQLTFVDNVTKVSKCSKFALAKNQKGNKKMPNGTGIEWRALYRMLSRKDE